MLYLNFEVFNVSNTVVNTSITNQAYTESKRVLTLTPGAFGVGTGAGPFGGGSLVERNLNRWTVVFAIAFAVNTIILIKIS